MDIEGAECSLVFHIDSRCKAFAAGAGAGINDGITGLSSENICAKGAGLILNEPKALFNSLADAIKALGANAIGNEEALLSAKPFAGLAHTYLQGIYVEGDPFVFKKGCEYTFRSLISEPADKAMAKVSRHGIGNGKILLAPLLWERELFLSLSNKREGEHLQIPLLFCLPE